jgi:hypothetical protein
MEAIREAVKKNNDRIKMEEEKEYLRAPRIVIDTSSSQPSERKSSGTKVSPFG